MSKTALPYHQARKRFGQNFLQDHGVISDIVALFTLNQMTA